MSVNVLTSNGDTINTRKSLYYEKGNLFCINFILIRLIVMKISMKIIAKENKFIYIIL